MVNTAGNIILYSVRHYLPIYIYHNNIPSLGVLHKKENNNNKIFYRLPGEASHVINVGIYRYKKNIINTSGLLV